MKEVNRWGTLGFILTVFSIATFLFSPESPVVVGFLTLPVALNILFAFGVGMLSIGCVSQIVDRL
ncbi:MAG: hypothetical protein OEX77_11720 [Candidatus Bathyarchaeota archaeon]|nr:hypothetical protein [Candidatus Bathyarchaeota archaeon]